MSPRQTKHPAQGLVSTAQRSASGRVPKTQPHLCLLFGVLFTCEGDNFSYTMVYCT